MKHPFGAFDHLRSSWAVISKGSLNGDPYESPRFPLKGSFKGDIGPYKGYIGVYCIDRFLALGFSYGPLVWALGFFEGWFVIVS